MKFTLAWLKDFLDTSASVAEISRALTAAGLEVESLTDNAAALAPFIVAEIKDAVQHPNADKLRVCQVDDGTSVRQVVCGAPNARAGIKVILAREGVVIPANGMVIKKSAIRSVESDGMLCSASELSLGGDSAGIVEVPADALLGQSLVDALGLGDPVFDIAITPNRADCLGVRGVARDLAAAGLGALKKLSALATAGTEASPIGVTLETASCPLFIGCLVRGVKNGPSPEWLKRRLTAIGLRPISALVDITNYMTYSYARPLHVYDAGKLSGSITVRETRDGETLAALNDKLYTLPAGLTAICDDSGVIGLGGVIGGASTGCSDATTDVFLESAWFEPAAIAQAGRTLAIDSDARYRFERGVDPDFVETGAGLALSLIAQICGGTQGALVVAGKAPEWRRSVAFDESKVETLGGLKLDAGEADTILAALGFERSGNQVTPPSWRADITGSADLVEEILRVRGYDHIPSAPLPLAAQKAPALPQSERANLLRRMLAARGMTEICSWAFVSAEEAARFGGENTALHLLNPISSDLSVMRPGLLPHLLSASARNADRGFSDLALFEIGNVFTDVTPTGQKLAAAALRTGHTVPRGPHGAARLADAFDAKADLFALLAACGLNPAKLHIDRSVPAWYHPARAGRISLGGKVTLGYFGELHPTVLAEAGLEGCASVFEAMLDAVPLPKAKSKARAVLKISNYQAVERDFAFLAGERIAAGDVVKAIESADKQLIQSVSVFDAYQGKGMEPGKKSLGCAVTLQATDRTLTEAEIEKTAQAIIAAALKLGLTLRV